jgi:hypothetical protein
MTTYRQAWSTYGFGTPLLASPGTSPMQRGCSLPTWTGSGLRWVGRTSWASSGGISLATVCTACTTRPAPATMSSPAGPPSIRSPSNGQASYFLISTPRAARSGRPCRSVCAAGTGADRREELPPARPAALPSPITSSSASVAAAWHEVHRIDALPPQAGTCAAPLPLADMQLGQRRRPHRRPTKAERVSVVTERLHGTMRSSEWFSGGEIDCGLAGDRQRGADTYVRVLMSVEGRPLRCQRGSAESCGAGRAGRRGRSGRVRR